MPLRIPSWYRSTGIPTRLLIAEKFYSAALGENVVDYRKCYASIRAGRWGGISVVHSGIFDSVMAFIPALKITVVLFDTALADLIEELTDPVELLFDVRIGGGNDTHVLLRANYPAHAGYRAGTHHRSV